MLMARFSFRQQYKNYGWSSAEAVTDHTCILIQGRSIKSSPFMTQQQSWSVSTFHVTTMATI